MKPCWGKAPVEGFEGGIPRLMSVNVLPFLYIAGGAALQGHPPLRRPGGVPQRQHPSRLRIDMGILSRLERMATRRWPCHSG